jgi:pimeloyl-ACP methyl ester carboxylesterase
MSAGTQLFERILTIDGLATAVTECGHGEPVLFIHGSGPGLTGMLSFEPILPRMSEKYRVLVVDMPGYGKSAPLPVADTPANVAIHLDKLLGALAIDRAHVVGHSRGGRIASELAFLAPQKVGKLLIIGSGSVAPLGHLQENGAWTEPALALVQWGVDGDTSFENFERSYHTQVHRPENLPRELMKRAYDEAKSSGVLAHFVAQMAKNDPLNFYHKQDSRPFIEKLRRLSMPTMVLWGREDRCSVYSRAVALLDIIPDLEFLVLPRCGHFVTMDRPEACCDAALGFLGRDAEHEPWCWYEGARQVTLKPGGG